ncbi:uncharacterized protein LOC129725045 [Wyeomyia smithii]|uniref:uncharacterized protein LOC129725045 n=1 Tax=Wyeomyia smithii TaxID=174621 RepID=UPI00246815F5|nr:uncharacterized protein LOC129725045 [Wyeomyia smithii]
MSLVAYDYSSDDESEQEIVDEQSVAPNVSPKTVFSTNVNNGHNTDMYDETNSRVSLNLPAPKPNIDELNIKEEDDEFLHKKAVSETKPAPPNNLNFIRANVPNRKVQIVISSLRDFENEAPKPKAKSVGPETSKKSTGLLSMLPTPKSTTSFPESVGVLKSPVNKPVVNRLIPDSVTNRTRNVAVNEVCSQTKIANPPEPSDDTGEDSDEEKTDFFSFNTDEKLPEISVNEIAAMVAKKAAKMAEAAKKFDEPDQVENMPGPSGFQQVVPVVNDLDNKQALATLIGGNRAKRARVENVNIIDISSTDIVPSKEDFLRRKLQEETGYVPTGHLTGDWTCTSKRKSHITYLASKAQANAQELEAMWSSNRQSRRQTQSKYGF